MKKNQKFLFGNEAVVQGALEAGVGFTASYPGTPASEIADTFAKESKKRDFYFEYSSNEKVALETAAGAALSNVKSLVSMKHYGLNVALDALLPLVYLKTPLVVVISDDPGSWSSIQAEQDSRHIARLGKVPTLEPSDAQEAKEFTKLAFNLAFKHQIPVLVRLTTRVALSRGIVDCQKIPELKRQGQFEKPEGGFKLGSAQTVKLHGETLKKIKKVKKSLSQKDLNSVQKASGKQGIITTGISYLYVKEAFKQLNLKLPLLKLDWDYPIDSETIGWFIQNLEEVLVIEELDPIIENEVSIISKGQVKVRGKDLLPESGEYKPEIVLKAIAQFSQSLVPQKIKDSENSFDTSEVESRVPFFCPGCPHRSTFYSVREALGEDKVYGGDIGCYMLGAFEPYNMTDYVVSMGSSIGIGHGISKATDQKPVVFIGDSTFFHAGLPGLMNLVYNQDDILVVVADNRYTAMTGQQPNPGTGFQAQGEEVKEILIEDIARAAKADHVESVNVYNHKKMVKTVKDLYGKKGVSVLVAKGECRLAWQRRMRKEGNEEPKFEVKKQTEELVKAKQTGCPAIKEKDDKIEIDQTLCTGCALCKQIAPKAIQAKTNKEDNGK